MASGNTIFDINRMIPHSSKNNSLVERTNNKYGIVQLIWLYRLDGLRLACRLKIRHLIEIRI